MKKSLTVGIISIFILSALAPISQGFHLNISTSGLVAYWKLDEDEGNIAYDSVNDFHGTVYGASWIAGKIGNALDFDGENDFIDLPRNAIDFIGSLEKGTIAFWFYYNYNLDQQEIQPMFYIGIDDENETDNMFIIEIGHKNPANKKLYVTWVVGRRIPLCFDTGFNLEEKRWYHFAVVVGPNGNTGYLNGVELINRHYNFGNARDSYFLSDIPVQDQFTIGYGKTADGKSPHFLYFDGRIDDVRIYDKPLNADEIMELYNYNGNEPPSPPDIDGTTNGKVGIKYYYTFNSSDSDGDEFMYIVSWGDGSPAEHVLPSPSGEGVSSHIWNKTGNYIITAYAEDENGLESGYGLLEVIMPRTKTSINSHWLRFFKKFLILHRLLDFII